MPKAHYNVGMIKSLIILVLLVIAGGGAAISKPSQSSFQDYYASYAAAGAGGIRGSLEAAAAKEYAQTFTYQDKIFWANVTKDGTTAFTGAFGHWFVRDQAAAKPGL
jgi:hypothetical protein